ncbi:carbon monoxide dehydrogenase (plasmid) [Pseudonocardia sp. EC080610-09]|uniref:xanthine dehydrogenase family protein molybdopterin-binding subunit n=1 Tax=unclassified Pseudonocardia TaxID=2619320 RepID=UPI000706437D|nr:MULTISPECIES: xanthine dehydrogenase family protein molybdopterin-binding subunit [unclassified Pseudonocardia]ALL79559.1 carbon monoxide dehydrogenase [Pseudonocardia sp. EC080610-09]ALL85487.1 carbon monoxide dehydrogenase [Pseudonocardia sp. EC080619-01]
MSATSVRLLKRDAFAFAGGSALFVDDIRPDGLLHMAVVRSTRAHARVLRVDTAPAKAIPGVVRVLEGREASLHLRPLPYQFGEPELIGGRRAVLEALPIEEIRYVGEPVAVVAAESRRAARAAAAAVVVDYDDLPALLDARVFLADPDPRHVIAENETVSGDADQVLRAAEHVIRTEFSLGRSSTAPIEPRGYLADWDGSRLTVHAAHQQPFQLRAELAEVLALPVGSIRVVVPNVGGAFGLKMTGPVEEPLVCLLAMLCGRPVKWIETRAECFLGGGREQLHDVEVAHTANGRILALRDRIVIPVGAEAVQPGWRQAFVSVAAFPTAYRVPHLDVRSRVVATNLPPWHSCRGFGKEAPVFVMERIMDMVARRTGITPAEVRRCNLLRPDDLPHRMASGYRVDSGNLPAVLDQVLELDVGANDGMEADGVGLAVEVTPEGGGHAAGRREPGDAPTVAAPEAAAIRLRPDGTVEVRTGVTNPGGGNDTALARLAAGELGIAPAQVHVVQGDTDLCPPGTGNASSRGVAVGGPAVVLAARALATTLDSLGVEKIDAGIWTRHGPLEHVREYQPDPPADLAYRYSYPYFSSGAYVARVDVDRATGRVRLRSLTAVHDCGRVIEPVLVEGQLQGAMAMGAGLALSEESRFDERGVPQASSFKEYLAPRANDLPDFLIGHHETPAPHTLLGAKGAGEAGVGGALAAIANAVDDALSRQGGREVITAPLDPPAVLALLPEEAS